MATFSNASKSSSTFLNYLRHGKEPTMGDLANYTFESVVFMDGTQLKNLTFDALVNVVWTNSTKN